MDNVAIFIGVVAAIGSIFGILIYIAKKGYQALDQNRDLGKRYLKAMREVHYLKEETHCLTMPKWPIWPRPVLYQEVDMETQMAFAQSVQEIAIAQSKHCQVRAINEDRISIFEFYKHIQVLVKYKDNLNRWEDLQDTIQSINEHLRTIDTNFEKIKILQNEVEKNIVQLQIDVNSLVQQLPNLQKKRGPNEFDLIRNQIENAYYYSTEAQKSIQNRNSEDGIEFARGYLCWRASQVLLDSFMAGHIQNSYPDNVELDVSSTAISTLNSFMLNNLPNISNQGWKSLMSVNGFLEKAEGMFGNILQGLKSFESKYKDFREWVRKFEAIRIHDRINLAIDVETSLSLFWGMPDEAPDVWQSILGEPSLPSQKLVVLKNHLQKELGPLLRPENIIKQSQIDGILKKFESAIHELNRWELVIRKIQRHLREQKDAQEQVIKKLSEDGDISLIIGQLHELGKDTSKEIASVVDKTIIQFNKYVERANQPKGADYPQLLTTLGVFLSDCKKLKEKHERQIAILQNEALSFSRQLSSLYEHIMTLDRRKPRVEVNLKSLQEKYSSLENKYKQTNKSYRSLNEYNTNARSSVKEFENTKKAIEVQIREFEEFKRQIKNEILALMNKTQAYVTEIALEWGKPLYNHQKILSQFVQELKELINKLENTDNIETLSKATNHCENVKKKMYSFADNILAEIEWTKRELKILRDKDGELQYMFDNAFELKLRDLPDARNIREKAREMANFKNACMYLDRARTVLEQGGDTISIRDIHDSNVNVAKRDISQKFYSGTSKN